METTQEQLATLKSDLQALFVHAKPSVDLVETGDWWKRFVDPPRELYLLQGNEPGIIREDVEGLAERVQEMLKTAPNPLVSMPGVEDGLEVVQQGDSRSSGAPGASLVSSSCDIEGRNIEAQTSGLLPRKPARHVPSISLNIPSGTGRDDIIESPTVVGMLTAAGVLPTSVSRRASVASNQSFGSYNIRDTDNTESPAVHSRRASVASNNSGSSASDSLKSKRFSKIGSVGPKHRIVRHSLDAGALTHSPYYTLAAPNSSIIISREQDHQELTPAAEAVVAFFKNRKAQRYVPLDKDHLSMANTSHHSECASCMEDHKTRRLTTLECQHKYCQSCLRKLIK